jgi:hypothetical protein
MRFIALCFIVLTFATACKKSKPSNNLPPVQKQTYLSQYILGPTDTLLYTWNDKGQQTRSDYKRSGKTLYFSTYNYDEQGRVIKTHDESNRRINETFFTYYPDHIDFNTQYGHGTYTLNNKGQIIKWEIRRFDGNVGDTVQQIRNYVYDSEGSFKTEEYSSGETFIEYTCDDKKNPFYNFPLDANLTDVYYIKHNPTKSIEYDMNGNILKTDTFSYIYNGDGLPVSDGLGARLYLPDEVVLVQMQRKSS